MMAFQNKGEIFLLLLWVGGAIGHVTHLEGGDRAVPGERGEEGIQAPAHPQWEVAEAPRAEVTAQQCDSSPANTTLQYGDHSVFTSPNYPSNYNWFSNCSWRFQSPAGTHLNLTCSPVFLTWFSSILIVDAGVSQRYDGCIFCSKPRSFNYNLTSNHASVTLTSGLFIDKGFSCNISVVGSVPCRCGLRNTARIVGGTETSVNKYPWVARVTNTVTNVSCGGTVLSDLYILSAAQCTQGVQSASDLEVKLGLHTVGSNPGGLQTRIVLEVFEHPSYNATNKNFDAVLLRVDNITFTSTVRPVCLPAGSGDYSNTNAVAAGWGVTASNSTTPSNVLHEVVVPVLGILDCRAKLGGADFFTNNMLCAGSVGKDSCQGDSGGPLTYNASRYHVLIGIRSWGNGCGVALLPGVYTRITTIMTWINTRTAGSTSCPQP